MTDKQRKTRAEGGRDVGKPDVLHSTMSARLYQHACRVGIGVLCTQIGSFLVLGVYGVLLSLWQLTSMMFIG